MQVCRYKPTENATPIYTVFHRLKHGISSSKTQYFHQLLKYFFGSYRLYERLSEVKKQTAELERVEMRKKNREKAQKFNQVYLLGAHFHVVLIWY